MPRIANNRFLPPGFNQKTTQKFVKQQKKPKQKKEGKKGEEGEEEVEKKTILKDGGEKAEVKQENG
jgi:hypothetical protein